MLAIGLGDVLTLVEEKHLRRRDMQDTRTLEKGANLNGGLFNASDLFLGRLGRQGVDLV